MRSGLGRGIALALALALGCGKGGDPPAAGGTATPPPPPPAPAPVDAAPVLELPVEPPKDRRDLDRAIEEASRNPIPFVPVPGDHPRARTAEIQIGPGVPGAKDTTPVGRVDLVGTSTTAPTSLAVEQVVRKIQSAYLAGIKRCYKEALRKEPTLVGNLTFRLTVAGTGIVTAATATAPTTAFRDCVQPQMLRWRFPLPRDADGEPTTASFELRYRLVPS